MNDSRPRVAIVVPNLNGLRHLDTLFDCMRAQTGLADTLAECVLVDNGSRDGSAQRARREPGVRLLRNETNLGFSAACNRGAREAEAAIVCFLNTDIRFDPDFVSRLIEPIVREQVVATTARMLSWDGEAIDFAGGGMNFHGIGIAKGYRDTPSSDHEREAPSLFPCGGAMAIDRRVFLDVGGFDEAFFAYYEDVDLGWRLWLQGHEVRYVPDAVCRHHHASTTSTFPVEAVRLLQIRNPLLSCFKNYDDENLRRIFPAALALAVRRMQLVAGVDAERGFRIEHAVPSPSRGWAKLVNTIRGLARPGVSIRNEAAADLFALGDLLGDWDAWMARRKAVQSQRRRSDAEIFALFDDPFWCIEDDPSYRELHDGLIELFELRKLFPESKP
ncbi:MAG: glycosyltransferase family 2 protein [Myxococcota bacterium]|jgi:hypothetical protein|nr:glycosyltransferase family 2 protein [Myxococcota bacterium]